MRASPEIHVEWVEDEAVVLDPSTNQIHYLNGIAALVYGLIQEHGFDEAMSKVREQMPPESESELDQLIEDMVKLNLLVE